MRIIRVLPVVLLLPCLCFFTSILGQDSTRIVIVPNQKKFIGFKYDFLYFDESEKKGWHSASVENGMVVRKTPIVTRINYANRFQEVAVQAELDAYPVITKKIYAYLNAGYSKNATLFPAFRAGSSVYFTLPKAFEAEAGFRLLRFSTSTWIYTAAISKYYKKYWISAITYVVPASGNVFQSYFLKTRYYFTDTDFLEIAAGTGVSPDDRNNNRLLNSNDKLSSNNVAMLFRRTVSKANVIVLGTGWIRQATELKKYSDQYNFSVGYQRIL